MCSGNFRVESCLSRVIPYTLPDRVAYVVRWVPIVLRNVSISERNEVEYNRT